MGYTTTFKGQFKLDRQLSPEHAAELIALNEYEAPKPRTLGGGFSRQKGPEGQPEWVPCDWTPTRTLDGIHWNGAEKFYDWEAWLRWIVEKRLTPWGYTLTGSVRWRGEDSTDSGTLSVVDGKVIAAKDVNLGDPEHAADAILAAIDASPADRKGAVVRALGDLADRGFYRPKKER